MLVTVTVRETSYGNPSSVGEPLGLWNGEVEITGDASGGFVTVQFQPNTPTNSPTIPDKRRQYLYFTDGVIGRANTDPGIISARCRMHNARGNTAITPPYETMIARASVRAETNLFAPNGSLLDRFQDRMPQFWDTQELADNNDDLVIVTWFTNTLNTLYNAKVSGRYYDRQVVSNRSFGRLIAPAPIAPLD